MTDESREKRSAERKELDRLLDIRDAIENIQEHPRYPEGKAAWDEDKYYRGYCERRQQLPHSSHGLDSARAGLRLKSNDSSAMR